MKLRIKGNSLRFRVTRSELETFRKQAHIEETICLGPEQQSHLKYALNHDSGLKAIQLSYQPPELSVALPSSEVERWAGSDQVGLYTTLDLGPRGTLDLIIEKDFACLHGTAEENLDAFPNPNLGT